MTKKHKLTKREKENLKELTPREDYEQVGSSPLTRLKAKSFSKCQRQKFQTGIFLIGNPLILFRRILEG
jgi:hypothetical protein